MWHRNRFYAATKQSKTITFAEKWMELESVLTEKSQIQKEKYCMFPLET